MAFDGNGWVETLSRYRPLLRLLAGHSLHPRLWTKVDPSDMVQKTMLEAHEKRADFRGSSEGELAAWLQAILRLRIIDEVRRLKCQRNNVDLEIPMESAVTESMFRMRTQLRNSRSSSPSRSLVRHEEALRLAEALWKLPEDQRRAVDLIYLQVRTMAETADLLGRSKGAVSGLLRRGLAELRELLKNSR